MPLAVLWLRLGRCGLLRLFYRQRTAIQLPPVFLDLFEFTARGDKLALIRKPRHQRTGKAGLRLGHQAFQLRDARADALVRGIQLVAVIEIVMRRIDEEARRLIDWAMDRQTPSGILSEQFDPESGEPLSVSPLVWSHAELINTLLDFYKVK